MRDEIKECDASFNETASPSRKTKSAPAPADGNFKETFKYYNK